MKKIGFSNFRKFTHFNEIELGDITYLVGKNNSGKSTLVKAILLINAYLKSSNIKEFSFGNNVLNDANIVTFERALNQSVKNQRKIREISFRYSIDTFEIEVKITGNSHQVDTEVTNLKFKDIDKCITFIIQPQNGIVLFAKNSKERVRQSKADEQFDWEYQALLQSIDNIKEHTLGKGDIKKGSKEYLNAMSELNEYQDRLDKLKSWHKQEKENYDDDESIDDDSDEIFLEDYFFEENIVVTNTLEDTLEQFIQKISNRYDKLFQHIQEKSNEDGELKVKKAEVEDYLEDFDKYRAFYHDKNIIEETITKFRDVIYKNEVFYLAANPAKQSSIFNIRNKENGLAQAIHDYQQLKIEPGDKAEQFIKKWMKEFDVGHNFQINMIENEAYSFKVDNYRDSYKFDVEAILGNKETEEPPKLVQEEYRIDLADKGMGSIQAMLLIMRLASIIRKVNTKGIKPLVLIEEPELNLHPSLQSKLCDLFFEVNDKYGIEMIVETHSEYLIRKSQLVVKQNQLEVSPNENPFTVLYFDTMKKPYKMVYREDGIFKNSFGKGFFDESGNLALELI